MLYWVREELRSRLREEPGEFIESAGEPLTSDDFYELGTAYDILGEKTEAERLFRAGLQKNICHHACLYVMAFKSFQKSHDREGRNFFRRAIRFDPDAESSVLYFQKELKYSISSYEEACSTGVWCLKELHRLHRVSSKGQFQLGKVLFEQSKFSEAADYLREVIRVPEFSQEATEYLAYIFEHLYEGEELIIKTLELAKEVKDRSDLFFNLAMVCQHDLSRLDLAMHFFYLAYRNDPSDPGLKFSLEQAALELISQLNLTGHPADPFNLMLAHIYQGAIAGAKSYADKLEGMEYPKSFEERDPRELWTDWLLPDAGPLGKYLREWFGGGSSKVVKIKSDKV